MEGWEPQGQHPTSEQVANRWGLGCAIVFVILTILAIAAILIGLALDRQLDMGLGAMVR